MSETPTISSIYAYLNGNVELKADILPMFWACISRSFSPKAYHTKCFKDSAYKTQILLNIATLSNS
ncbi:hypothetical protein [Helicobacter sp.]|uniref:hypothetical protein n=1 Tax=Helicobacter sp. TaxID=218 RepID=UPI0025C4921F|nr:hypothetical protein [Helicobacter sp.]MBR2494633.1 hypothetical protein [Helicobacter sp.]